MFFIATDCSRKGSELTPANKQQGSLSRPSLPIHRTRAKSKNRSVRIDPPSPKRGATGWGFAAALRALSNRKPLFRGLGWVGLEPTTNALKGRCSTIELPTRLAEILSWLTARAQPTPKTFGAALPLSFQPDASFRFYDDSSAGARMSPKRSRSELCGRSR